MNITNNRLNSIITSYSTYNFKYATCTASGQTFEFVTNIEISFYVLAYCKMSTDVETDVYFTISIVTVFLPFCGLKIRFDH